MSYRHLNNPLMEPEFFTPPGDRVDGSRRLYKGGGGGGGAYYESLSNLYATQNRAAEAMQEVAERTVLPGYERFYDEQQGFGSVANQELARERAMADAQTAYGAATQSMNDQMASFGIDPGDQRYINAQKELGIRAIGESAAGMTGAVDNTRNMGYARQKDALSMGMGMPSDAVTAMSKAGQTMGTAGSMSMQQSAMDSQNTANMVRGGMGIGKMGYDWYNSAADGGLIRSYAEGGYVNRYASGGLTGAAQMQIAPPPAAPPQQPSVGMQALDAGAKLGAGQLGKEAYKWVASKLVDKAMPTLIDTAPTAAPTAYAAAPAATTGVEAGAAGVGAAEAGAAGAATTAGVGAAEGATVAEVALELAPLLLAADGGHISRRGITPGAHGAKGGEVDGPGGPKDDMVPAMLSDGEFVLPIGTVKKYGLAKLEKMRQEGLEFERQLGIRRAA